MTPCQINRKVKKSLKKIENHKLKTTIQEPGAPLVENIHIYESLFLNTSDLAYILDKEGQILKVNEAAVKATGFSAEEIQKRGFFPFVCKEDLPKAETSFQAVLQGSTQTHIFRINRRDGGLILLNSVAIPIIQENQTIGIIGISKDITAEENLKQKLSISEQMYRSLFDNHPDAVYSLDLNGDVTAFNESLVRLFDYDPDMHGISFRQFVAPESMSLVLRMFKLAAKGKPQNYNMTGINRSGEKFDANITNIPIITDNQITGVFGIAKDITELADKERKLQKAEERLNLAQKTADFGYWDYYFKEDSAYWSEHMYEMFGVSKDEFIPSFDYYKDFIHPEDLAPFLKNYHASLEEKTPADLEYRIIRKDGQVRRLHHQSTLILDGDGNPERAVGISRDVTEQREIEDRLAENTEQFKSFYNNSDVGVWSLDPAGKKVLICSDAILAIYGYTKKELYRDPRIWNRSIHPDDMREVMNNQNKISEGNIIKQQYRIITRDGKLKWVSDHLIPIYDENGRLIRLDGIVADITAQKQAEAQMEFLAYHDYMTGLPNRRLFDQTLNGLFEDKNPEKFAIMYLDLDRFKHINDTLGHPIGDQVLKEAAERIKASIRKDDFASRMGGDEFAIIAPNVESIEDASRLAAEITGTIQKPYEIEGYELFITASIGISLYPNNGSTPEELARNADAALYHAKQMGKSSHQVYNASMNIESFKKYCLERDMRNALKDDQFYVEFQPKIEPRTHKLAGAEALLRWNHPDWGIVSPMEFIPVAEESGLIVEIGDWVIENVIAKMEEWQKGGLSLVPISINVSGQRFYKNNLAEMIGDLCQKHGISPTLLELELTESSLIHYSDQVLQELEKLGQLKIKLSLDDFGTGFSSLTHLRKFKFNTLKIDKSFTKNIISNLEDATITSSLIDMAHGLNMKVVAEGVEEFEQLDFLKKKGCDEIQGFLFSRPVSGIVFRDFLKEGYILPDGGKGLDKLKKQRKYFRIDLPLPLGADLTILKLKDKQVEMGKNEVLIENIGPGGARLYTNIKLPIRQDILFQIQTKILGETLSLDGHIVWKEEKSDLVTQYGLEFSIDDKRREELTQLLNEIQGPAEKGTRIPGSRQVEAECPVDYFG